MKLPILRNNTSYYPLRMVCPMCKITKITDESCVTLGGGACLLDRNGDGGPSKKMEGFLHISGVRIKKGRFGHATIHVAEDVIGGQFDLYFCSIACFKTWFHRLVDELEKKIDAFDEEAEAKEAEKFIRKYCYKKEELVHQAPKKGQVKLSSPRKM